MRNFFSKERAYSTPNYCCHCVKLFPTSLFFFYFGILSPFAHSFYTNAFILSTASSALSSVDVTGEILNPFASIEKIAVTGATGRTGSLVVEELLKRKVEVVALVRDVKKAEQMFGNLGEKEETSLTIVKCNLASEKEIRKATEGCSAAVWCATGFSNAPGGSIITKIKKFIDIALIPKQSIDIIGLPALAHAINSNNKEVNMDNRLPKVVMLSSAGVTRPSWDDEKKIMFPGAADIPIVRLNPFGILDIKKESEDKLRETGVDYCIVRPCGLNDGWPSKSRPIFSQGDIAVGRINREDVSTILVKALISPSSVGKTFEAVTMRGYPPAPSIDTALSRLILDSQGVPSNEMLQVSYGVMQQLLPGETQDSAGLAMGQTYEQLDEGVTGRLGKRGEEDAESAAPKPS